MGSALVLTKDHYEFIKDIESINDSLRDCVNNFISIGFKLSDIKENKSYELIGYKTFEEFAKTEFSLGSTSCKNYIAVAKKFGDKESLKLLKKYDKYSLSQLTELLSVEDDSIEKYSPALTTKQIRSLKIINQLIDYKEKFKKWVLFYIDENKEEIESYFKLRADAWNRIIYFYSPLEYHMSFFYVEFDDGYYTYKNFKDKIYDLDFERFQESFKKEFLKAIKAEKKKIDKKAKEDAERKEKEKADYEASLPENQSGLSEEQKYRLRDERLQKEKLNKYIGKIQKNKKYVFDTYISLNDYGVPLTYRLFIAFNKINYYNYPLIYKKGSLVGLINGTQHIRFYDDRVESYNHETKAFENVFSLMDLQNAIYKLFKTSVFGNLIDFNPDSNDRHKEVYLVDLEKTLEDIKNGTFGFEK